ncbi:MAG: bifunctional (p)ppGpp synthetase/guanosine-3',5'-bis(diphosphate) 3'-pyrophosphohydrolase [Coriobacteriia bacterium]|nr:bifunctional (p)ppGpp synthetase/guanosine-3',5'-bis(diphosphate) 3'-pyrophosphohydrolase [Coriobacteriia bacterium]
MSDKDSNIVYSRARVALPEENRPKIVEPDERFKDLKKKCAYLDKKDMQLLEKAYKIAKDCHDGQVRKSGEAFVIHPIEVAIILSDLRMDIETLCAALLHDSVEDTELTSGEIKEKFNFDVALLVEGVTKITQIEVGSVSESQAMTLRKMFVAMSNDLRVIVIKLADRLHNMRTLYALKEDRRIFKANETLEIFAPIAHRLGIDSIKWELEDLSFYYLEPNKYKQISRMVVDTRDERKKYLEDVIKILKKELKKNDISGHIMGRPKHLYSIYNKMKNKGKGFSEIYDLIAVRVIVNSVPDCYSTIGAVHALWTPIPGRFKDYIAMPKNNMYQSLHTSVIGPTGRPLEVQVRTEEMHKTSEYGVAAHWRYKEKSTAGNDALNKQLAILREMVNWQDDTPDSKEMLKTLKVDLVQGEVFVFTPEGEAKSLRAGSTPVDFAYSVHTQVGHTCVGAKVNGNIVPLNYELKTGDRVEILTLKSSKPSRDWLSFVKTPSARSKIRQYFSKQTRNDDLQTGHELLLTEMRKHGMGLSSTQAKRCVRELAHNLGFNDPDELIIQIGNGKESVKAIANKLLKLMVDDGAKESKASQLTQMQELKMQTNTQQLTKKAAHTSNGIVVKGIDDVAVRLSKCCNPVPGDEIIGFVTRGRGISVHRLNCPNAEELEKFPERIIEVNWDSQPSKDISYNIEIAIETIDRMGLLSDITTKLSTMGANFVTVNANAHKDGTSQMKFLFQVSDLNLIGDIIDELKTIDGVINVYRL